MFISDLQGILINLKEDDQTRYQCEIWFDYTRENMEKIKEGAFLAAPNFSVNKGSYRFTILEIVSILPIHYGLGEDVKGYPGFIKEAARSAFSDWTQQENEVKEDTTQIRVLAVPTNLEVTESNGEPIISNESSLPMSGGFVHLIDAKLTHKIANRGIDPETDNIIKAGHLIREDSVETFLLVEELLQVHFGIFGFTGAGKSNLLSTLVAKLLQERTGKDRDKLKIVFFDLMSEYATLALDLLTKDGAYLIGLESQTFPGSVIAYLAGEKEKDKLLDDAARDMANTSLLPKALKMYREDLIQVYRQLLKDGKIKVYQRINPDINFGHFVNQYWQDISIGGFAGEGQTAVRQLIGNLSTINTTILNTDLNAVRGQVHQTLSVPKLGTKASTALRNFLEVLDNSRQDAVNNPRLPEKSRITVPWLVEKLNNAESDNLFIIQSHNPDDLRNFSNWLGNATYEARRRSGQINPLVSFIFDEADEFIPQTPTGTYNNSTEIAMTLARRGRKFGLGIGLATQRITYLDTSILAQPHTYFVSKLPRESDQKKIRDAFGISEEMFRQTVKFKKGHWLLVSYDATGLEAVPLPIQTPDANQRLIKFLQSYEEFDEF